MSAKKKLIGIRIPETVVIELRQHCKSHGILINYFVAKAIESKLKKVKRDEKKKKEEKQLQRKRT